MSIAKWYKIKLLPGSHITQRFLRFSESKFSIIICADDSGRRLLRSFQWSHLAEWAANKSRALIVNIVKAHSNEVQHNHHFSSNQSEGAYQGGRKESEWQNWVRSSPGFLSKQFGLPYPFPEQKITRFVICTFRRSSLPRWLIQLLPFFLNVDLHHGLIWFYSLHYCTWWAQK